MELIDTHTHLGESVYDQDREKVIAQAVQSGVKKMLVIGCEKTEWEDTLKLCRSNAVLRPSLGLHPHYLEKNTAQMLTAWIEKNLQPAELAAFGEIGLDYYRNLSPQDKQKTTFAQLVEYGKTLNLPLIIHCREAFEDTYAILKEQQEKIRGVVHCFSGDLHWAEKFIQLGFHLGITGPLTYPKSGQLKQVVKEIPLDKLLLETDCPYLPPQAWRGKRNEPQYLIAIAQEMAKIKNISVEEVGSVTTGNAEKLFGL
ncbi:MAG: TatD family hydrolase [Elusimicrobiota bacterium]